MAVGSVERRIALAVARIEAGDERQFLLCAGGDVAGRRREVGAVRRVEGSQRGLDALGVPVAVVVDTAIGDEFDALEMIVELEVDDARDRVRAVNRRCAAGQHFDAVDQGVGDHVDVGGAATAWVAGAQTQAIDEHQRALGIQAAQVHGRRAARTVDDGRTLRRKHLRQLVEQVLDPGDARLLNLQGRYEGHGADRCFIRYGDTRAGDDDFLQNAGIVGRGRRRRLLCVHATDGRGQGATGQGRVHRHPQQGISEVVVHHMTDSPVAIPTKY